MCNADFESCGDNSENLKTLKEFNDDVMMIVSLFQYFLRAEAFIAC